MNKGKSRNFFMFDSECEYPLTAPYYPETKYPEYPFVFDFDITQEKNDVYRMVRELFIANKMDYEKIGTTEWNPLKRYIVPGSVVLIKPNLVCHVNSGEKEIQKGMDCLITHPSIVRAFFDYVYIALKGEGKIIIADAPVQGCDFDKLLRNTGYGILFSYMKEKQTRDLKIDIADLRGTIFYQDNGKRRQEENRNKKYEGIVVDLGAESYFGGIKNKKKLRVTDYAAEDTIRHHSNGKNEYCISEALLEADVVINLVKPKTHRIAGYTGALKNIIGICTGKEYLPHHRQGSKRNGGDEYTSSYQFLKILNSKGNDIKNWALKRQHHWISNIANEFSRRVGRVLDHKENNRKKWGGWYGNDTIWRTILDVNHIVYYLGKDRKMHLEPQRKIFHFGDMIICGEGEGPLTPSYKRVGGILFSDHPVAFDVCVVKLMGFDYKRFPTLVGALNDYDLNDEDINEMQLYSNENAFNKRIIDVTKDFAFQLSSGWREK